MLDSPRPRQAADPAKEASDLIVRLGVFVLAAVMPCAAVFSRRAIFPLTPIGAILLLVAAGLTSHRSDGRRYADSFFSPLSLSLAFLAFWAGLSLAWTPWLASASERFLRTVGTIGVLALAGAFSPHRTKTSNLYLLPFGVGLSALATIFMAIYDRSDLLQQGTSLDSSTLARASVGALMLAWPALAGLAVRERWTPAAILACAAAAAVLLVGSPFAVAALAVGAATFALSIAWPRWVGRLGAVIFGALFALAPVVALALSAVRGTGFLGELATIGDFVRTEGVRLVAGHGLDTAGQAAMSGMAPDFLLRSAVAEIWYELGALGALGAALASVLAFRSAARTPSPLAPFVLAALASGMTLTVCELPLAQLWWLCLVGVACLFFVLAKRGRYRTERPHVSLVNAEPQPRQPAV